VVVRVVRKGEGWSYEKHFDIALLMRECVQSESERARERQNDSRALCKQAVRERSAGTFSSATAKGVHCMQH